MTNTDGSFAEPHRTYGQRPSLEKRFNTIKSILNIAPFLALVQLNWMFNIIKLLWLLADFGLTR